MIQHSQVSPPIERKRKKGTEPSDDAPEPIGSPTSSEDADQSDDDAEEKIVEYVAASDNENIEDTLVEYVADVEYSPTVILDNTYVDDQQESNLAIIPSTNSPVYPSMPLPPTHSCTRKKRRLRSKTPPMAATTQGNCSADIELEASTTPDAQPFTQAEIPAAQADPAPHACLMAWVTDYVDAGIRYHLASKMYSDIIELN